MSSSSEELGGGGYQRGGGYPPRLNVTDGRHPRNSSTVTTFVTVSESTTQTTTVTTATTISEIILTAGPTVTTTARTPNATRSSARASETSLLRSNASLTRANITVSGVLGSLSIIIIICLALIFCLWVRRRRREREDAESPPFTSLASRPPPGFLPANMLSSPESPQVQDTSLSMGPLFGGQALQAFGSHPPNEPVRPLTASAQPPQGVPAINVQPNTPSAIPQGASSSFPTILQPSAARMPEFHEAPQEEAEESTSRVAVENAGRPGLPVIGRARRASVSTIGSDIGYGHAVTTQEPEGNGARGILHSTRASSGVFPDS